MRKRILVALALLALNVGVAGVAVAVTNQTSALACVSSSGALKLAHNGSCGTASKIEVVGNSYPGVARAYAHVIGGEVDAPYSWNVSASNLYTNGNGAYCFKDLGFTPSHVQVSLDYWGPANGDIPVITVSIPPNQNTDCGLAELPDIFVFTGLVDPGVFTDGVQFAFYITIY